MAMDAQEETSDPQKKKKKPNLLLHKARAERLLTQEDLAAQIGVYNAMVSR